MPVYRGSQQRLGALAEQSLPKVQLTVRPRSSLDPPAFNSADALGLGPPPPPDSGRRAVRLGLGLFGTLATIIWMWGLAPPPI